MLNLNIGAGDQALDGYVSVDPYYPTADIRTPGHMLPYNSGSVDHIYSSHALEHIEPAMVAPTLAEWYRVLRVGGICRVIVPDAQYIVQYNIDHPRDQWAHIILHGQNRYEGDAHKTAFDMASLVDALRAAGFERVEAAREWTATQQQVSIVASAVKL